LQWKARLGSGWRFPVNAGWIGTHAGIESVKLPINGIPGLPAVNRTHLWPVVRPGKPTHSSSKGNVLRPIPQCPMVQGRVAPLDSSRQLPVASDRGCIQSDQEANFQTNSPKLGYWQLATGYWQLICSSVQFVLCLNQELTVLWPTLKSRKDPRSRRNPTGCGPPERWRPAWLGSRYSYCVAAGTAR